MVEEKIEDRAMEVLERLSNKLNTPIAKLYGVMVKQVKVDAINAVVATAFLAFTGIILKYFWSLILPYCVPGLQGDGSWPAQVILEFAALTLVTVAWGYTFFVKALFCVQQCIGAWLNPEGVAFNRIIRYFN